MSNNGKQRLTTTKPVVTTKATIRNQQRNVNCVNQRKLFQSGESQKIIPRQQATSTQS
jgi:hypothetical protein